MLALAAINITFVGIKIHNKDLGKFYPLDLDLYLSMITTICFGSSSLFREKVRNKKLISNFYTEWESVDKMHVFYIMASSENPDELLEEIKNEFNNLKIEKQTNIPTRLEEIKVFKDNYEYIDKNSGEFYVLVNI